ncbi:MAG: cytochrome c-type biogenesis protein CcmH [Anaerolineae bacterium]|nr:cytochrome c-type biogenesis protein CcmH [Anaerolineae bacterium]
MARLLKLVLIAALCLTATLALAQDTPAEVTADQVNAVAEKLYCPVCENIPLDTCGTAACADWRNEIKLQLEAGMTPDEVITDFVRRFGDRVVGIPQDPALNALTMVTVVAVIGAALLGGVYFLLRNRRPRQPEPAIPAPAEGAAPASNAYYDLLRQDVEG